MRYTFLLVLLLQYIVGNSQSVYYFSSSMGSDAHTSAQARNQATPWKSLQKLNELMRDLQPGDKVLLKRGDRFDGSIRITKSGNASRAITISAYGTGNKPVVNGFTDLRDWTKVSTNIWQAFLNAGNRLNMLTIRGRIQPMGRYPNLSARNMGYLSVDDHDASNFDSNRPHNSSITASSVPASKTNWTGAELCIRAVRWMLNKHTVLQHSGNRFTYANAEYEPINGFGFFIQNDERTLDEQGEWYYDQAQRRLRMYAAVNPATLNVKAAVNDTLLKVINQRYVTIDNIAFQGANHFAVFTYKGSHLSIRNCTFTYSGDNGINTDQTTVVLLDRDSVMHTNNNSIYVAPFAHNSIIQHCYVQNSGMVPGFGRSGNQAMEGIVLNGNNSVVKYCRVDSIGYNGIVTSNDSCVIQNNFISNFNLLVDDGAGIYTAGTGKGRKILGNIIINGVGNHYGTGAGTDLNAANGIGLDDYTEDVIIDGNSVANCSREGVGLHNAKDVIITNNTFYNIKQRSISGLHDRLAPNNPIRNITVKHNIFFATGARDMLSGFDTRRDFADLTLFGKSDSNYWCRPFNSTDFFQVTYTNAAGARVTDTYNFAHWKAVFKQDLHSVTTPVSLPAYRFSSAGVNKFPAGNFSSGAQNVHTNNPNIVFSHDRNHLDDGCLQIASNATPSSAESLVHIWFIDFSKRETFQAGKTYRVTCSVQSQKDNQNLSVLIRGSNPAITPAQSAKAFKNRTEIDLVFTPTQNIEHAWVELTADRSSCPIWIDNLQIREVQATSSKPSDYFRFEYNATASPKTIQTPGNYVDVKGKLYRNSIELAPYSSVVLIKKDVSGGK